MEEQQDDACRPSKHACLPGAAPSPHQSLPAAAAAAAFLLLLRRLTLPLVRATATTHAQSVDAETGFTTYAPQQVYFDGAVGAAAAGAGGRHPSRIGGGGASSHQAGSRNNAAGTAAAACYQASRPAYGLPLLLASSLSESQGRSPLPALGCIPNVAPPSAPFFYRRSPGFWRLRRVQRERRCRFCRPWWSQHCGDRHRHIPRDGQRPGQRPRPQARSGGAREAAVVVWRRALASLLSAPPVAEYRGR